MNNLIEIEGGDYNDIKKALQQWINLYSEDFPDGLIFNLYTNRGRHFIQADERLDNEHFYYLVNYLYYPEDIEYKVNVTGFTIGKDNNILKNKHLLVFIPPTDKEYDNVYISTSENENYKIDFSLIEKIKESSERRIYRQPTDLTFGNPEILKINESELDQKQGLWSDEMRVKLLKIFLLLGFFLLSISALSILVFHNGELAYYAYNTFIVLFGMFVIWGIVMRIRDDRKFREYEKNSRV